MYGKTSRLTVSQITKRRWTRRHRHLNATNVSLTGDPDPFNYRAYSCHEFLIR